jgi:hypothetical protein
LLKDVEVEHWDTDSETYGEHIDWLCQLVEQARTPAEYVWLEDRSSKAWWSNGDWADPYVWWIASTVASLKSYSKQIGIERPLRLDRLFNRHRCVLFASCSGEDLLGRVKVLLDALKNKDDTLHAELSIDYERAERKLASKDIKAYLSWRLLRFHSSHKRIVCIPLLAVWNDWPSGQLWAPPRPATYQEPSDLSSKEAARLLENVLHEGFADLLGIARSCCGLSRDVPEFAGYKARFPAFYFAEPAAARTADVNNHVSYTDLDGELSEALLSADSTNETVAQGVLRNCFHSQRKEAIRDDGVYYPRYIIRTANSASETNQKAQHEIEENLENVFSSLTFQEFTYGDDAKNLYDDLKSINDREPVWKDILTEAENLTTSALDFLPDLDRRERTQIYDDFRKLHVLQIMRVESRLEGEKRHLEQLEDQLEDHKNRNSESLRRRDDISSGPGKRQLKDALCDPLPYRELNKELESSANQRDQLNNGIKRIQALSGTANAVLETADQREREKLSSRTNLLGIFIGFLAVISLAEFIPGAQLKRNGGNPYPEQVDGYLPLPPLTLLETTTRILIALVSLSVLLFLLYFIYSLARDRLPRLGQAFGSRVQALWSNAESGGAYSVWARLGAEIEKSKQTPEERKKLLLDNVAERPEYENIVIREPLKIVRSPIRESWNEVEKVDKKATKLLHRLWKKVERVQENDPGFGWGTIWKWRTFRRSQQVAYWLRRDRRLRYRIDLFVLCPEAIPVPRTLCIFRYKSGDLLPEEVFSDEEFEQSLDIVGFSRSEIRILRRWLSQNENLNHIREMSVKELARTLEERTVKADPKERKPEQWKGSLK